MTDTAFLRQLEGFALTTAEIIYRLPDHQMLLQSYIWQDYDLAPRFPKLTDFLDFWSVNLEGALYRIRIAHRRLIAPAEFSFIEGGTTFAIHHVRSQMTVANVSQSRLSELARRELARRTAAGG